MPPPQNDALPVVKIPEAGLFQALWIMKQCHGPLTLLMRDSGDIEVSVQSSFRGSYGPLCVISIELEVKGEPTR